MGPFARALLTAIATWLTPASRRWLSGHTKRWFLDGTITQVEQRAEFDGRGGFRLWLAPVVGVGGRTILVQQQTDQGLIRDATTFLVTVEDK